MKKEMIYAIITSNSRRTIVKKLQVKNSIVTFRGKSYDVTSENFGIFKKLPVYFYDENNKVPHNPISQEVGKYTAEIYNKGLRSKIISELLAVLEGKSPLDFSMILTIINFFLLIGVGVLVFVFYKDLASIILNVKTQIDTLLGGLGQ